MERITERDEFGNADIISVGSSTLFGILDSIDYYRVKNALNLLAEYEDTGLSPSYIEWLKKAYEESCLNIKKLLKEQ